MSDTDAERLLARTVDELREQLQNMRDENQTLRVGITQRDRWITELRSTVAAFMGTAPYPLHIRPKRENSLHSTSE